MDRVGCFEYSPVSGAAANDLPNAVPDELKKERWERFMEKQQVISAAKLQSKIGWEMDVLVDHVEDGIATCRSYADAPEIDGVVTIEGNYGLRPGDLVPVVIEAADDYDLWASPLLEDE